MHYTRVCSFAIIIEREEQGTSITILEAGWPSSKDEGRPPLLMLQTRLVTVSSSNGFLFEDRRNILHCVSLLDIMRPSTF